MLDNSTYASVCMYISTSLEAQSVLCLVMATS